MKLTTIGGVLLHIAGKAQRAQDLQSLNWYREKMISSVIICAHINGINLLFARLLQCLE